MVDAAAHVYLKNAIDFVYPEALWDLLKLRGTPARSDY